MTTTTRTPARSGRRCLGLLTSASAVVALLATPASADDTRFLSDIRSTHSGGSVDTGSAAVNGTTYVHSEWFGFLNVKDEKAFVEYDLGRKCSGLTTTVGLRDDSDTNGNVVTEVLGDGVLKASTTSRLGQATPVSVDLTGVLRLRVQVTALTGTRTSSTLVLGDAAITCAGVTPARVTASASTGSVASGGPSTLSGTVTDVGGAAVAAREVHVLGRRSGGSFQDVGTAVTDEAGRWSLVVRPVYSTRYLVRTEDSRGRAEVNGDSQPLVVVRGAVSIAAQRLDTRSYRFYGRVSPRVSGKAVALYRRSGGRDTLVSRVTTRSDGSYDVYRTFSGSGRFDFFVRTGNDGLSTGGVSPVRPTAIH